MFAVAVLAAASVRAALTADAVAWPAEPRHNGTVAVHALAESKFAEFAKRVFEGRETVSLWFRNVGE